MIKKKSKIEPTLAETIRQAILDSEITRYRIAKDSGVGAGVLSRFVHGGSISIDTADKLCKVLGLSLTKNDE